MELTLTPEMQRSLEVRVKSGRYATPEDVIRAALAALEQQDEIAALSADELEAIYPGFRQKIAQGIADADAGRMSDGEEFFDKLDREEREGPAKVDRKTA